MIITAIFKSQGAPAAGLTPTIDVFDITAGAKVVSATPMIEVGGGVYKYNFTAYDPTKEYATICDGGSSLNVVDRYATGGTTTEGQVDQILTDTAQMQADLANGGRLDLLVDGIKAKTDNLPSDPASQLGVQTLISTAESKIRGADGDTLKTISDQVDVADAVADAIKAQTDLLPVDPASGSSVSASIAAARAAIIGNDGDSLELLSDQIDSNLSAIQSIQNNTTTRIDVPTRLVRPDTGTKTYRIILGLYDSNGNPEAPDSVPTIQIENVSGIEKLVEATFTQFLGQAGQYYFDLAISSSDALEVLVVRVKVVEAGVTTYHRRSTEVTEFEADINEVQANVSAIKQKTDYMPANTATELAAVQSTIDAVKVRTDNLPANTASELDAIDAANASIVGLLQNATYGLSSLKALIDAIDTSVELGARFDQIKGVGWASQTLVQLDSLLDDIKAKTANLPVDPASGLTVAQKIDTAVAIIRGVDGDSLKTLSDQLDAGLDEVHADVLLVRGKTDQLPVNTAVELAGLKSDVAQAQVTLDATKVVADLTKTAVDAINVTTSGANLTVDAIKERTDRLPDDPASESNVTSVRAKTDKLPLNTAGELTGIKSDISTVQTSLDGVNVTAGSIKERTDRLPDGPASESNVTGVRAKTDNLPVNTALDLVEIRNAIADDKTTIYALLTDASYGLGALRVLLDAIDTSAELADRFAEIKGVGWTNETLTQIDSLIDAIKTKTDKLPADTSLELAAVDAEIALVRGRTDGLPVNTALELVEIEGQIAATRERTDRLPDDPASQSAVQVAIDGSGISDLILSSEAQATMLAAINSTADAIKADVSFIRDIEGGRWAIEGTQMVFYKQDNVTEVARFDLLNAQGRASTADVFERRRA